MQFLSRAHADALSDESLGPRSDAKASLAPELTLNGHGRSKPVDAPPRLEVIEDRRGIWTRRISSSGMRAFDILFSLTALILSAPLMIVLGLTLPLSSPGQPIYRARRLGVRGHPFDCLKFRTMVLDADKVLGDLLANNANLAKEFNENLKLADDPRITRIGRFLRRTSLDELPQFWNILKGDMSVVGPRPKLPAERERYGAQLPLVLSVRPGLTGLWQVSGRNSTSYAERVEMDRQYVLNRHFGTDMLIIAKTVRVMLRSDNGAY